MDGKEKTQTRGSRFPENVVHSTIACNLMKRIRVQEDIFHPQPATISQRHPSTKNSVSLFFFLKCFFANKDGLIGSAQGGASSTNERRTEGRMMGTQRQLRKMTKEEEEGWSGHAVTKLKVLPCLSKVSSLSWWVWW